MLQQALGVLAATAVPFLLFTPGAQAAGSTSASAFASAAAKVCRAGKPHAAGTTAYRLESGGVTREYLLYVPARYDGRVRLPVIFDFHGSGSNPEEELQVSGMAAAAERHGFLVLLPVAAVRFRLGGHTWNVPPVEGMPDDVRFADDALRHAAGRVCVDDDRVYAAGFSGGARLASELACALPGRIAALGAVGGLRAPRRCDRGIVPVVAFHGTADPVNPYAGGGPGYWGYGVDAAVHAWAAQNRCAPEPTATRVSDSVLEVAHAGCEARAEVVLYRIAGGGHTWPGSRFRFPVDRFGTTTAEIDATERMVEFFARHAKPAEAPTVAP